MNSLINLFSIFPLEWLHLLAATLCGFLIGFERQLLGKPSGMRTSVLIALSVYIFMATAKSITPDYVRILGQIITGVGFLGGGVIISREGVVQGMTSAASIWMLSAIGIIIGLDYPLVGLKITLIMLIILWILNKVERNFKKLQKGVHKTNEH